MRFNHQGHLLILCTLVSILNELVYGLHL
jgi:hypothetical protein